MNVLLFRHGRNYYEDEDGKDLAGQLNPAGAAYAASIPNFADVVARQGLLRQLHAWQDENQYDRCVETLRPLSNAANLPIETYSTAEDALAIATRLQASNDGGWAVMCVRTQDCKRLKSVFQYCDALLSRYEDFVIYTQAQPGQGNYTSRLISMGHEIYPDAVKKYIIDRVYMTP